MEKVFNISRCFPIFGMKTAVVCSKLNKDMKKTVIKLSLALFTLGLSTISYAQEKDILNWYNGKTPGMNTEKAYKMVKKKESTTVVVAIIDSGIDTKHEDLQGQIWVNEKEIPGNGIDDDGNGYIDDVHGWNFLGNANGENMNDAALEVTRLYAELKAKYDGKSEDEVEDKAEYAFYKEVKDTYNTKRNEFEGYLTQINMFKDQMLPMIPTMVGTALGKEDYTIKDLEKWKPEDAQMQQMKQVAIAIKSGELTPEVLDEQLEQIQGMMDTHYNLEKDFRSVVGDNPNDFADVKYGNGDVKGPDALHGTHVGGIVGSVRGNGLGGDGVATNIKLMSVRAVPNGDEYDKDIALAIRYAVDNGAKVINMSFGKAFSPHQKEVYEAMRYAEKNDVLLVNAAGNDAINLDEENSFPSSRYDFQESDNELLITIGASTRFAKNGELAAAFSNYGKTTVDIFAPGFEIYNTVPENEYQKLQGTSMAAPMVSGVAAMIKSYYPSLTMKEIKDIIIESGKDYSGTMHTKPGASEKVDFGTLSKTGKVVDLLAAMKLAEVKAAAKN
jgi:subtilisin family serine protease